MKPIFKVILTVLLVLAFLGLGAHYIASYDIDVLNPKGVIAYKERDLIITAISLMMIVVIPVYAIALIVGIKFREKRNDPNYQPNWSHSAIAEAVWWGVPCLIIAVLAVITYQTSHSLNPFKPIESKRRPMIVQAVALDWKWLFIYPEQGIAVVNYMELPTNRPIKFEITADAPMNSFWVPQLAGQIYAMPAMKTQLHVMANEEGEYRGRASNISGKGFAGMTFKVKATSQKEFNEWVAKVKQSEKKLDWNSYLELVKPTEYVPVINYQLVQPQLFDNIIKQYQPKEANVRKIG